jgi:cytochrome b561
MSNPFVKDDNDGVNYISVVDIIKWALIALAIYLLVAAIFFSVPTMSSGTLGLILMLFLAFGIFVCPLLIVALLVWAYKLNKSADAESDKWERAQKRKTAKRMRIAVIFLAVYMVIVYVSHILITIGYTITHPWA